MDPQAVTVAQAGPDPPRPSLFHVLAAAWLLPHRPGRAGAILAAGSRGAMLAALAAGAIAWAAAVILSAAWLDTLTVEFVYDAQAPAGMTTAPFSQGGWRLDERSIADVWRGWHQTGPIGPVEFVAVGLLLLPVLSFGFLASLFMIHAHRQDSAWDAYKRAFRALTAATGPLVLLTTAVGWCMVYNTHEFYRRLAANAADYGGFNAEVLCVMAIPAGLCLLLWWMNRAVRGARGDPSSPVLPPCCEGCGYNLTHVPDSGRCPECGLVIGSSLTPGLRRPGCSWEEQRNPAAWARTSFAVLVHPQRFYGRLKLRTPDAAARRFAVWHYVLLGLAAGSLADAIYLFEEPGIHLRSSELIEMGSVFAFTVPLGGWLIHRTVGAVAATVWLVRGTLPDSQWALKVIAYETAFLWVFGAYNGGFIVSFFFFDLWMMRTNPGRSFMMAFGMPPEAASVLGGTGVLCLLWLWRFFRAGAAIRWSNF